MDHHQYGTGGNWMVMPMQTQNLSTIPINQDYSQQSHLHPSQIHQQAHNAYNQHQQQQQQSNPHQSIASNFHLLHLVESLADSVESGTRDQNSDVLIKELINQFERCHNLLNSIASSIGTKAITVERQKHKLEEAEQLLNERRDLMGRFRSCIEDLIKPDGTR